MDRIELIDYTPDNSDFRRWSDWYLAQGYNEKISWPVYLSGISDYENSFGLTNGTINRWLQMQKRSAGNQLLTALDFMSTTTALRDLTIDRGIAIGLTDPRNEDERLKDADSNISVIAGNAVSDDVWPEVDNKLVDWSIEGFDLILWRPCTWYAASIEVTAYFFQSLVNRLANQGLLLASLPPYLEKEDRDSYDFLSHRLNSLGIPCSLTDVNYCAVFKILLMDTPSS